MQHRLLLLTLSCGNVRNNVTDYHIFQTESARVSLDQPDQRLPTACHSWSGSIENFAGEWPQNVSVYRSHLIVSKESERLKLLSSWQAWLVSIMIPVLKSGHKHPKGIHRYRVYTTIKVSFISPSYQLLQRRWHQNVKITVISTIAY